MKILMSIAAALAFSAASAPPAHAQHQSLRDIAIVATHMDRNDHPMVMSLQRKLRSYGYYSGPIDGVWGPMTHRGVQRLVDAVNAGSAYVLEAPAPAPRQVTRVYRVAPYRVVAQPYRVVSAPTQYRYVVTGCGRGQVFDGIGCTVGATGDYVLLQTR